MSRKRKEFQTAFGAALDAQLRERDLSATDLATRLGVSKAYVSATMTGRKSTSPSLVQTISTKLVLSPWERLQLNQAAARDAGWQLDEDERG